MGVEIWRFSVRFGWMRKIWQKRGRYGNYGHYSRYGVTAVAVVTSAMALTVGLRNSISSSPS